MMLLLAFTRDGQAKRAAVLREVQDNPGINKKQLCERLGVAWNTVRHHVRILERQGALHVEDRGWEHALFPIGVPASHRPWLKELHDDDSAIVLEALVASPGIGVYDLSADLGLSRKVIRAHLARFMDEGLVRRIGTARPRYVPVEPPSGLDPFMRHSDASSQYNAPGPQ